MAEYLVAVSGGIDSVVLLDVLVREGHKLTVAHFDHGIRGDSAADARFVSGLAKKYGLPFVMKREELGANASEELARNRRYAFLRAEAKKRGAAIATAHHADDVIETIAINLLRGTGWRGLAVLDSPDIHRPLLGKTKAENREYALKNRLEWVEDSTNAGTKYLRNRVRRAAAGLSAGDKQKLLKLWRQQRMLKETIDTELAREYEQRKESLRYFLTHVDPLVARELLRAIIYKESGMAMTRPQAERALLAVKTAQPRAAFEVGGGITLRFSLRTFVVETL